MTLALPPESIIKVTGVSPEVADAIRDIYVATEGNDLAVAILDAARDPESPLHKHFQWDDTIAAERWRKSQAEALLRRVKVTIIPPGESTPIVVRAYVSDRSISERPTARRYVGIEDMSDHGQALVASARRDIAWLRNKYKNLAALSDLLREAAEDIEGDVA